MKLFAKAAKPAPQITVDGIEVAYDVDQQWWAFFYEGREFVAFEPNFGMPSRKELDGIIQDIETLKGEMKERLHKGWQASDDAVDVDNGESYLVQIEDVASDHSFAVSWSGGNTWGDTGIDFKIRDHQIIGEQWGD